MSLIRLLFFTTLFLSFDLIAQPGIGSAKSLVKIEFEDLYGLKITHPDVNLEINTIEKFNQGTQTNWLNSHLVITGISSFEINIKAIQSNFVNNNLDTDVSVSNIKVSAKTNLNSNTIILKDVSQVLITENNGSLINYVDVNYQIPPENTFAFINNSATTFETLIIYTLIPN